MNEAPILQTQQLSFDTVALYQYIYKNAQLGMGCLGQLLEEYCDDELKNRLCGMHLGYTAMMRDAANVLAKRGIRPIGLSAMEKLYSCLSIRLAKIKKDVPHAYMISTAILHTTKSSIEATKKKSLFSDADEESKALMERLLRFEEASNRALRALL